MEVLHTYKLYQYNYEVYGSLKLLDSFGVEWGLIYQKSDQSVFSRKGVSISMIEIETQKWLWDIGLVCIMDYEYDNKSFWMENS